MIAELLTHWGPVAEMTAHLAPFAAFALLIRREINR